MTPHTERAEKWMSKHGASDVRPNTLREYTDSLASEFAAVEREALDGAMKECAALRHALPEGRLRPIAEIAIRGCEDAIRAKSRNDIGRCDGLSFSSRTISPEPPR